MGLCIHSYGFVKKKYHEKSKQNTLPMPKAIRQTRLNRWTKDEKKVESQQGNLGSYRYIANTLIFKIYLISLLPHPLKLQSSYFKCYTNYCLFSKIDALI